MLETELDTELGYEKHDVRNRTTANSRNGKSKKTLTSEYGDVEIQVPKNIIAVTGKGLSDGYRISSIHRNIACNAISRMPGNMISLLAYCHFFRDRREETYLALYFSCLIRCLSTLGFMRTYSFLRSVLSIMCGNNKSMYISCLALSGRG